MKARTIALSQSVAVSLSAHDSAGSRVAEFFTDRQDGRKHAYFLASDHSKISIELSRHSAITLAFVTASAYMAAVTIRGLPEETMQALRVRAKRNGRSLESEICEILQNVTHPPDRIRLGSGLAALGKKHGGVDIDIKRDPRPFEAADFV